MIFSCTSATKIKIKIWKKNALRILNVIFPKTEHDGHFTAIRFGGKSHIQKNEKQHLVLSGIDMVTTTPTVFL